MKKIFEYSSFDEDLIKSKNQDYILKENYKWIHSNVFYIIFSYLAYYIVLIIAFIYCKLILRIKYKNHKVIIDKGYFLYSNHTLTVGDVLNPFIECFPRRPYIICSSANLGIPLIGKILPLIGALPIPNEIVKYKEFTKAVEYRCEKHPIIIYPEAHLWPYYTGIRPFTTSSFHYPVDTSKNVYTATTTFQNKKIIIYYDDIGTIDKNLSRKEKIKLIHDEVATILLENSKLSNTEKCIYIKK